MKAQPALHPQHNVTDALTDRVIDILDAHTDIGVIDCADGRSILTWETTCDLARAIAADEHLVALLQQRELGGAA
jgi:hypothetical protein